MKIKSVLARSFGNGTRPKDFEFGTVVLHDGVQSHELHIAARANKHLEKCDVVLCDGVNPTEMKLAILNIGTTTYVDDGKAKVKPAAEISTDWQDVRIADIKLPAKLKAKLSKLGVGTLGDINEMDQNELTETEQTTVLGIVSKYAKPDSKKDK